MPGSKYTLKLFIAGRTLRSENAINNLERLFSQQPNLEYELQVIDILERPDSAEESNILATPTLIREAPLPVRRLIGDLADSHKVIYGLDLSDEARFSTQDRSD